LKDAAQENRLPSGVEKSMLSFGREKIGRIAEWLGRTVSSYRFALAAFLVPLFIRSIPEILVGPYPIGWDTIAFYVPNTLDWAAGKADFTTILGTAPLMYMISVPVYILTRVNPVWIFKVMGPILYGAMIWALFRFLRMGLKWPDKQALGGGLLTSLYFVTLRISWDLYRNMLGLTMILLAMPLLEDPKNRRRQVLLSVLVALAVASDQLTGVIALLLVGVRMISALIKKEWVEIARLTRIASPGAVLFLLVVYTYQIAYATGVIQNQPTQPSPDVISSSLGFLGYAYLGLSPMILIGLRRVSSPDLRNWLVFCAGAIFTALLPFFGLVVATYRWTLLIDLPLCIYAAAGLSSLLGSTHRFRPMRPQGRKVVALFSILLVISAGLYIALPAQQAFVYYTAFPPLMATSMVQATVPMSDMHNLQDLLGWVASRISPGTVLITHQAIYGWIRAYLPALSKYVVNYGYSSPLDGIAIARSAGYSSILMIWWVNGSGWHGLRNVPSSFWEIFREGDMAVYNYN